MLVERPGSDVESPTSFSAEIKQAAIDLVF